MEKNITNEPEKLYVDINPDVPVQEIESLCVSCEKNGITRLLLTKIPFFKDIIIMSFECSHCGLKNNEIQPASNLSDFGVKYVVRIVNSRDLNRRVVKSEFAEMKVSYCNLEIPPKTQKGKLTTIEGFLTTARDDMQKAVDEGIYDGLENIVVSGIKDTIKKLTEIVEEKCLPVEFIISDPSGNSFVENPFAPNNDPYCTETHFVRTKEMSDLMGYSLHNQNEGKKNTISKQSQESKKPVFEVYKSTSQISAHLMDMTKSIEQSEGTTEAITIPENCMSCLKQGENRTCVISIPFFKELIITCFTCSHCNFKTSEVRGGGGISEKATKITLKVEKIEDLCRDMFKSETAKITIPEVEFESSYGSLGSMFTTVEGIVDKIVENTKNVPFSKGDSSDDKLELFANRLQSYTKDFKPFTLIIDDPASNSFLFSINHENPENDKQLLVEEYERTWEQNEDLGLNDMNTENYHEDQKAQIKEEDKTED